MFSHSTVQWCTREPQQFSEGLQAMCGQQVSLAQASSSPMLLPQWDGFLLGIEGREQLRTGVDHTGLLFVSLCVRFLLHREM